MRLRIVAPAPLCQSGQLESSTTRVYSESMKLSTRSQYGLRIMLNLGLHAGDSPLQLSEISSRERISEKYLGQIIMPLRSSGLVNSVRGAQGGYLLSRPAGSITVLEIVEALEGEVRIVEPSGAGESPVSVTVTEQVWNKVNDCIRTVLTEYTLEELLLRYSKEAALFDFSI